MNVMNPIFCVDQMDHIKEKMHQWRDLTSMLERETMSSKTCRCFFRLTCVLEQTWRSCRQRPPGRCWPESWQRTGLLTGPGPCAKSSKTALKRQTHIAIKWYQVSELLQMLITLEEFKSIVKDQENSICSPMWLLLNFHVFENRTRSCIITGFSP